MAHTILSHCYVDLDGNDVSGHGTNVAISMSAEVLDITPFGTDTKSHFGGSLDFAIELEFIQDESAVGSTFFDMIGEVVPFEIRPTDATVSESNPAYKGFALCTSYTPISGGHGEVSRISMSFVSAADPVNGGEATLIRDTVGV